MTVTASGRIALTTVSFGAALLLLGSVGISSTLTESALWQSIPANTATNGSSPANDLMGSGDWPTYLENPNRTSSNLAEKTLSSSNAPKLKKLWVFNTSGVISGSTTVVGNVAYVGSWNGFEYALNASTGELVWATFLGNTSSATCPGTHGIASSATVEDGNLYIGGGDGYFYVVNAATGVVEWRVLVGPPSMGYYNWASPLLYDGFAYVGVASYCDKPLVPGGLLQINLTSELIQNEFHTTASGVLGSSVWGSPSVDARTNTVFFATGNNYPSNPGGFADSVIAVNASNVSKLVSSWSIPLKQQITDGDFGSSATLFNLPNGTTMMGALDKNGYFYAFYAANLSWGPAWADKVTTGQSVGSAAFGQGLVYVAAGTATYNGIRSSGAAWALDPNNGSVVWEQTLWGKSVSAPAYANGILFVDGAKYIFVLNATTGHKLKELGCHNTFYSPPAIAHGRIFAGCTNGQEFAYGIPALLGPVASGPVAGSPTSGLALSAPIGLARWV